MDDGSTVPIILQQSKPKTALTLPEEREFNKRSHLVSTKIKMTRHVRLKHSTQTWVEVTTKREVTILVDSYKLLYRNVMSSHATGIANVDSQNPFRILVANFTDHTVVLLPHHVLAAAAAHPENLKESRMSHADMLGLINDERDTKFRKRHVRDIDIINKHLTDQP